jgi:hypothetical protein
MEFLQNTSCNTQGTRNRGEGTRDKAQGAEAGYK